MFFSFPSPPEAVKKLFQAERAGRDIGPEREAIQASKVLQRYLFALTPHDGKFK
jgi:hypothetical protein